MKKLISLVLVALMLTLPALGNADCGCGCGACICGAEAAGVLIAKSETAIQANVFTGISWWALTVENRVFGKISPMEQVSAVAANPPRGAWIGGCVDNGVVRDKHTMTVIGEGYGLTQVEVRIELRQEAVELVERILWERLEVDTITANAIIAATMWWEKSTVCHVFFLPDAAKMWAGTITAGKNTIELYAGEWGGVLVLGFVSGSCPAPTPEPEPEATPAPTPVPVVIRETVYVKETVVREVVQEKACVKVIQNNFQVNVNSTVTNTQKVIFGGSGCKKAIPNDCVKD